MMEGSRQQYVAHAPVDEPTCWRRLFNSRAAMFFYGIVALSPLVDVLSDLLTAASFAYTGHPWWAALTLAVFYMSGRLMVVFMALCPTPNARNLVCLYLPGLWKMVDFERRPHGTEGLVANTHSTPRQGEQQLLRAPPTNQKLKKVAGNGFSARRVSAILKEMSPHGCWGLLLTEIRLFPYASLAIIPIGVSMFSLSRSYMSAAFGRADDPGVAVADDGGSDPAASRAETRKKARPFQQTFSMVEALFEGFPQLMLQIKAGFYGDDLDRWVLLITFPITVFCIVKAIVTYVFNRKEIREAFLDLHGNGEEEEKEDIQRAVIDLYVED